MNPAIRMALVASFTFISLAALAAPVEERDFFRVDPAQPTSDPSKIVVTEYFSYQCPHCYSFARPFAAWSAALPADVKSERVAVSIGHSTWVAAARAYYALVAMKAVPAIDDEFFSAVHRKRAGLTDESTIAAWVGRQELSSAEFTKFYSSFSVQLQTKRADELSRKHRIPSVPSLVIDGKYLIPIADDGGFEDQLNVALELVDRVRRERASLGSAQPAR